MQRWVGGSVRRVSGAAGLPPNTSPNRCSGRPSGESKAPQPSPHPQQPELLSVRSSPGSPFLDVPSLSSGHQAPPGASLPQRFSPWVTGFTLSSVPSLSQVTRFLFLGLSASLLRALGSPCPQDTGLMLHSAPFSLLGLPGSPRP